MKIARALYLLICIIYYNNVIGQINNSDTTFILINDINVVDVSSGKVIKRQNVALKGQYIYYIGNTFVEKISNNTKYIDGKGKYLCPGLWDMHFHMCWDINNDTLLYPALLKNGITGIRDMGGDLKIMNDFKHIKPENNLNIFGAGPMIDGNPPVYRDFSLPVDDSSDIMKLLDSLKNNGSEFIKTYSLIKEEQLKEVSAYCEKNNFHFAGHLSEYVRPETSIVLGQKSIEHLNGLDEIWNESKYRFDSLINLMLTKQTYVCPTIIIYQLKTKLRDTSIVNKEYSTYISSTLANEWKITWAKRVEKHKQLRDWKALDKTYLSQLKLIRLLNKRGVMILAGSDFAGMPYVYPGISLHQELKLLTKTGLSNQEALKAATLNPVKFMKKENLYGSVSVGKFADLIILDKNPITNIENLKTINTVILKGHEVYKSNNNK